MYINKKEDETTVSERMEQFIKDEFAKILAPKKTFLEWVNYPQKQAYIETMKKCREISNYYDKVNQYEKKMYEKQEEINKRYRDRLTL